MRVCISSKHGFAAAFCVTMMLFADISAQQSPGLKTTLDLTPPGIQPLTAESLQQALMEGETAGPRLMVPVTMRAEDYKRKQNTITPADAVLFAALMEPMPFGFWIVTPYSSATILSETAKRSFQPRPVLSLVELNSRQVVVHVGAAGRFADALSIQHVVLKRGSQVVRPINEDIKPVQIQNGLGAARTVSEGDFTFPFPAFDPSMPVTIVMVGPTQNFEWTITIEELARMK
jgi:hypothetical protein